VSLPTTKELLLAWDAQRPRSKQTAMGMSELGSCHRRAGYHLQGYEPDEDFSDDKIQAVMGTAIHECASLAARMLIPQSRPEELEVQFAGLLGHPDLYMDGVVRDIKTLSFAMMLEQRKLHGPPLRERFQVHTYGAGLILAGHEVHTVQINYLTRDTGEEYLFAEPFSVAVVEEAMAWLDDVSTSDVTYLSRDYRPSSAFCQSCPWFRQCWDAEPGRDPRSVLFRDDPDAAAWARRLKDAQARRKAAENEEADAKGALDALRTVTGVGESEDVELPGLDEVVRFRMNKGRTSPDMARIAMDYKRAGARPPVKVGEPVVSVTLAKRKEER